MCKRIIKQIKGKGIWSHIRYWFPNAWSSIESWISRTRLIPGILYPLILAGVALYFLRYFSSLKNGESVESPLTLAMVAVTLGGFILLGAFYKERSERQDEPQVQKAVSNEPLSGKELKRVAKLFLGAAICFVVTFLMVPALGMPKSPGGQFTNVLTQVGTCLIMIVAAVAIGGALIAFTMAIVSLANIIRKM